jgi:signal transduction histidine kinase
MIDRHDSNTAMSSSRPGFTPEPAVNITQILNGATDVLKLRGDHGLHSLSDSLLNHCLRLGRVERTLARRVLGGGRRGASNQVRQIEMERARLGRELHTGVGQVLAAMRLQLEIVAGSVSDPPPDARKALDRMAVLLHDGLDQVRSVSQRLHPPEWQRLTLESAVCRLWEISGIPERYDAVLEIQRLQSEPSLEIKILIYRSVQEALSNIVRHSNARHVELRLTSDRAGMLLRVHDNGTASNVGTVLSGPAALNSGIGLRSIREYAASLGCSVELGSGPLGTTLEVYVPKPSNSERKGAS